MKNSKTIISSIVAAGTHGEIGKDNEMLWRLPDDFKWFKDKTTGHPMIMGRNTMHSLGKALPNRQNIVVSSSNNNILPGFIHCYSLEEAFETAEQFDNEEIFIVGGATIYAQTMELVNKVYYTRVHSGFDDAAAFVDYKFGKHWKKTFTQHHVIDERHLYAFDFEIWEKD